MVFLSFLFLLASTACIVRLARPGSAAPAVLAGALIFSSQVIALGRLLSWLGRFGDLTAWNWGSTGLLMAAGVGVWRWGEIRSMRGWRMVGLVDALRASWRWADSPLWISVAAVGAVNLAVVLFTAPGNWDSLSYHCARVAYYLQNNSLSVYPSNFWAQVVHGQNSAILMAFAFLTGGRHEGAMAFVQYIAYWLTALSVYGIGRAAGRSRRAAGAGALVFASLTSCVLEASTPQNDLVLAAFLGMAAYFLLRFQSSRRRNDLVFAALAICLGMGTKISFAMALPSLGALLWTAMRGLRPPEWRRAAATLAATGLIVGATLTLPGAYWDNLRLYKHPVGPPEIRRFHSFEGRPRLEALRAGSLNVAAFGLDFVTLDGLPPVPPVHWAQRGLRRLAGGALEIAGIHPERTIFFGSPPSINREPVSDADLSNWGLLAFTLLWPCSLLAGIGVGRPSSATRALAIGAGLFVLAQAFAGPYDPFRGRYFIAAGVLTAPVAAHYLERGSRGFKAYFFLLTLLQSVAVLSVPFCRTDGPALSLPGASMRSIFLLSRLEQLTRNRPELLGPLHRFSALVPPDASVHLLLEPDSCEYIYFGRGLTRRITAGPFVENDARPLGRRPDFLLFHATPVAEELLPTGDIRLGGELFLRDLRQRHELIEMRLPAGDEGIRIVGFRSLAPWAIEPYRGRPLFWLGQGMEKGLALTLWAAQPRRVLLSMDAALGPARPDPVRHLALRRRGDDVVVASAVFSGRDPRVEMPVTLVQGDNEFSLECTDEVTRQVRTTGDLRDLLALLHRITVLPAPSEEAGNR